MTVAHNGFTFSCDSNNFRLSDEHCPDFDSDAKTERTAIAHARAKGWFIGTIRITKGGSARLRESVHRTLCPHCKWFVGVLVSPRRRRRR
jgi:hypothetical protein